MLLEKEHKDNVFYAIRHTEKLNILYITRLYTVYTATVIQQLIFNNSKLNDLNSKLVN